MLVNAYGVHARGQSLELMQIERSPLGPSDVRIDIAFCSVCHTGLHQVSGKCPATQYPHIPGREIVGRVSAVGGAVTSHQPGDLVGIGCIVDSCKHCSDTGEEHENDRDASIGSCNLPIASAPSWTVGGYLQQIVVHERYVLRIRHREDQLAAVAPLLRVGIRIYSPLRHWGAGPGKKIGVVGVEGLARMAIKLARAMGAKVVAFATSDSKRADAFALGAHDVVSSIATELEPHVQSFDLILSTVDAPHEFEVLLPLLKRGGKSASVGAPGSLNPSGVFHLVSGRRSLAGSMIHSIPETQEMLDLCAEHGITADI